MLTMMQILGYFELIVYIYIVCNRLFIELHDRNAHKASLFAMHFFAMHLLSRCTCFRDALAFADRLGGDKTDDYLRRRKSVVLK
jgi:hypothetical protein